VEAGAKPVNFLVDTWPQLFALPVAIVRPPLAQIMWVALLIGVFRRD
jgi:hypothetical protein